MSRFMLPIPDMDKIEGNDVDEFLYLSTPPSETDLSSVAEICAAYTSTMEGQEDQISEDMVEISVHTLERAAHLVKELFGLIRKASCNTKSQNTSKVNEPKISSSPHIQDFQKERILSRASQNMLPCVKHHDTPQLLPPNQKTNSSYESFLRSVESKICAPTNVDERNKLCELHARAKKVLDIFVKNIESLQTEKKLLVQTGTKEKDAGGNSKLIENDKLQDDLGQQVCRLMRILHSMERELKNSEHLNVLRPQQSATSISQVCEARQPDLGCKQLSSEMPEPQPAFKRNVPLQPCRFIDDYDQFCIFCNQVFSLTTDLLNHLHKSHSHDMEHVALSGRPWASLKHTPKMVAEGDTSWMPLRGVDFLIPCSAFFCNLCKEFYGDVATARCHLENEKHNLSYDKFCTDNPKYAENMRKVHKTKKRTSSSQESKPKGTDDVRNPIQNKVPWRDLDSELDKEPEKGKAAERVIARNLLSKPAANLKLPNLDVVSDIMNMMSHDLRSSKTASPDVNVRCVQDVSGIVELSLTENKQIEPQFCDNNVENELNEAVTNIPIKSISPAMSTEDSLNIKTATGSGGDSTQISVPGDQLREAMDIYGKKTAGQSILNKNRRGRSSAQNKSVSKSVVDANEKLKTVCKALEKSLPKTNPASRSTLKKNPFLKIKLLYKPPRNLASSSSVKESTTISKSDIHLISNLSCNKNGSEFVPECESKVVPVCESKVVPECESGVVPECESEVQSRFVCNKEKVTENSLEESSLREEAGVNVVKKLIVCETGGENASIPVFVYENFPDSQAQHNDYKMYI